MKMTIDDAVKAKFPELHVFFKIIQDGVLACDLNNVVRQDIALTDSEFADYQLFRKKSSGNTLLAVERLLERDKDNLPKPDPITSQIVRVSYKTRLPLTIFCSDSFSSIVIRFSKTGDVLKFDEHDEVVYPGLLVADTNQGLLGILGTESSSLGKLSNRSGSLVILSFGCGMRTSIKSKQLVDDVTSGLNDRGRECWLDVSGHD